MDESMNPLRMELDSVKKLRNAREWRNVGRARCDGLERTGDGNNIRLLSCDLIDAGHSPDALVEIYRGETLCFTAAPLGEWATGKVGKGDQPEHLRRHRDALA